jgi:hypothetical protein
MRRTWTIIGVADVARSVSWYQTLLGLAKSAPAHDYFGQILDADVRFCSAFISGGPMGIPR